MSTVLTTPVAIVGGGPGGSITALSLAALGIESTIIEKDAFPRYRIGESMTAECGKVLRGLGLEDEMMAATRRYPVKRGVKVFGNKSNHFWVPVMDRDPLAGLTDSTTWQVQRSDFDKLLLDTAVARGSTLVRGTATAPMAGERGAVRGVRVETDDGVIEVQGDVLVDASGPACFLSRNQVTGPPERGRYDKQLAVFSQVEGAVRDPGDAAGNTLIFIRQKNHWAWFIPVNDKHVSIGVVVPAAYFRSKNETRTEFYLRELSELHHELRRRLDDFKLVEAVRAASNYSYEIQDYCGPNYLCVGDAHRFIDPVFSFGLQFAVKEGTFAAEAIARYLAGDSSDPDSPFADYKALCDRGMDAIQDVIDAFWDHPFSFAYCVHVTHVHDLIDLFAGRVYGEPSAGLVALRKVNATRDAL